MTLPAQLAPWRAWLEGMTPDLAAPLGHLLLQLAPLLERMNDPGAGAESMAAGAGSIARRGPYERLLLSEHAVADAAPDEFLRRAAAGELLFSAPEPDLPRGARVCVALFDSGPEQLGEPRLAQMALFILLARRAGLAGAGFRWGILQDPCALRDGPDGLQAWLAARSLTRAQETHVNEWNVAIGALGERVELWQIGASDGEALARLDARVSIAPVLSGGVEVTLSALRRQRTLLLAMPDTPAGARLLHHPFKRAALPHARQRGVDRLSLTRAPQFGLHGDWIAAAMEQQGAALHHAPSEPARSSAGRRLQPRRVHVKPGTIRLGTVLSERTLAWVDYRDGALAFTAFPDKAFGPLRTVALPPAAQFLVPDEEEAGLPTFFLSDHAPACAGARVFMLDRAGQLGCWKVTGQDAGASVRFDQVADQVVGAAQLPDTLVYARNVGNFTTMYALDQDDKFPTRVADLPFPARRVLFGAPQDRARRDWVAALEGDAQDWVLAGIGASPQAPFALAVAAGATVVGVARSTPLADGKPALLVLDAQRRTLALHSADGAVAVLESAVPIAQVALDTNSERLCWVDDHHELHVRLLYGGPALLHVGADGAGGASDAG